MCRLTSLLIPALLAVLAGAVVTVWAMMGPLVDFKVRKPGMDEAPLLQAMRARPVPGKPVISDGQPSKITAAWPCFRGPGHDAISHEEVRLARNWPAGGPKRLWSVELGKGHAAAAVSGGRVFVLDYVQDPTARLLRGLSIADRGLLARSLGSLPRGGAAKLDRALRPFFPQDTVPDTPDRRVVSKAQYEQLEASLGELLANDRDKLLHALRENALNEIDRSTDTMRCLSLDDGKEIWRNSYRAIIADDHGMSRTIPVVVGKNVISFGPLGHVVCWDVETGEARWLIDLVQDYGATVPQWYTGQCPLVDEKTDRLILAPGGKSLMIAVDYKTGKVVWETPNPHRWLMTHSSIIPMDFANRRMYVYFGKGGVVGVEAETGKTLWETADWNVEFATCPSPVPVGDGRIFCCGGYTSDSAMLQLVDQGGKLSVRTVFRRKARQFGSEQQTPILWDGHILGLRQADKRLVCLDLDGNEKWHSGRDRFGSAPFIIADGLIFAMNDEGWLTMAEASTNQFKPSAKAQVIQGGEFCWGPMALVAGRLIVRDFTRMVCLDVAAGDK
jgi:outer membrane protein assembly factor BamB